MDRLTDKSWKNFDPWECCGQDAFCGRGCHKEGGCTKGCIVPKLYDKLAKLEDAEEQGRMVIVPFAVGQEIWAVIDEKAIKLFIKAIEITSQIAFLAINHKGMSVRFIVKDIGKTVFATQAEAEEARANQCKQD